MEKNNAELTPGLQERFNKIVAGLHAGNAAIGEAYPTGIQKAALQRNRYVLAAFPNMRKYVDDATAQTSVESTIQPFAPVAQAAEMNATAQAPTIATPQFETAAPVAAPEQLPTDQTIAHEALAAARSQVAAARAPEPPVVSSPVPSMPVNQAWTNVQELTNA